MANNYRCGDCGRRDSNNRYGCLNSLGENRRCWDNYPYYNGPCPDRNGNYESVRGGYDDGCGSYDCGRPCDGGKSSERRSKYGIFSAMLPMAVAPNGIIPLVNSNCFCPCGDFAVNCGLITVEEAGTYLATYTVRVPEGQTLTSNITLNVNDACQSTAITEVGGQGPVSFTAQAICDMCERSTVSLRSSEAINLTNPSVQPLVTLSLVRI
ncbi:MAG: hypothetical protein IJI71_08805 [Clostridia bacterium]|nr:hypothetical protein [Clostridia bacterium]